MNLFSLLTVLLLVTQAPIPIPRQTPNSPTTASHTVKSQRKDHNAPSTPPVAVIDSTTTPSTQPHGGEQGQDDQPHSVNVRELPPVAIKRDLADWGLWVFTGLLVIVGAAQALYVAKTLSAVKEQSKSLKRQNDMIVSKERARLRVDLQPFSGVEEKDFPATIVKAEVSIFGSTLASVRDTRFFTVLGKENGIEEAIYWWPPIHNVPEVISPNSEPIETSTILHRTVNMLLGDEGIDDVLRGEKIGLCHRVHPLHGCL
jgi:hypothetical protein